MTPKPSSSSDGSSLPPRHRPALGNLSKDTTESDLWAFDDIDSVEDPQPVETPPPGRKSIPVPRDTENVAGEIVKAPDFSEALPQRPESDSISVNVSKRAQNIKSSRVLGGQASSSGHSRHGSDFDELDSWEESEPVVISEPARTAAKPLGEMPVTEPAVTATPASTTQPLAVEAIPSQSAQEDDDLDEFSPRVRDDLSPASIRPTLNLTKIERISLGILAAVILIGSGVLYFNTISRLPSGVRRTQSEDFPVKGEKISVLSATTFWRIPVTSGDKADTVRRDALLIPVVDLATSGGPAAIRVFFRNSDGLLVGDAVSRSVHGEKKFQVPATDGFNDMGMHAAYRTGQTKPWTIEVFEAPSEDSAAGEFKKVFEMNIAADRR